MILTKIMQHLLLQKRSITIYIQNQRETLNRYETLTKEVRKLEGKLADYNLAFDKQRAETRPEDIRNMYEHVKV